MWSLPWRSTEATWASLRVQCSSLSPSPGWTRWLWVTPTPCVSGRNRNHHAKARTWAPKAPAQPRKRKPLYLTPLLLSLPTLPPAVSAPWRCLKPTYTGVFFSAFCSDAGEQSCHTHLHFLQAFSSFPPLFWERLLASPQTFWTHIVAVVELWLQICTRSVGWKQDTSLLICVNQKAQRGPCFSVAAHKWLL